MGHLERTSDIVTWITECNIPGHDLAYRHFCGLSVAGAESQKQIAIGDYSHHTSAVLDDGKAAAVPAPHDVSGRGGIRPGPQEQTSLVMTSSTHMGFSW